MHYQMVNKFNENQKYCLQNFNFILAQFVAPLIHTGDTLAPPPAQPGQEKTGPKCFFYVFDYQTKDGDYPQVKILNNNL